ncbi:MAG: LysR family transcriptional regulator [Caldimonas sp.]
MQLPVSNIATSGVLLADLRLFFLVVESEGLALAARSLGLSKTSVTRQLQRLEAALGQRLLNRGSGRFALTEEGRDLLLKIRAPLSAIDEALAALAGHEGALEGRLRIAAPYTFGRSVIAPALPAFMAEHPGISVSLELSSRKVDLLADEADIAIRVGAPGGESLVTRRLARDQVILCATPSYLEACVPVTTPADLSSHRLLDFRPESTSFEIFDSGGRPQRISSARVALRSNEPEVLVAAVREGAGIALVPDRFVREDLIAGTLLIVLPGCGLPARDICALYAPGRRQSRKIRAFLDHLVGTLR